MEQVPARDQLSHYPFDEAELEEIAQECGLQEDETEREWRRLFDIRETKDEDDRYILNDETIVREWAETLENKGWFQEVSSPNRCSDEEPYGSKWRIDVDSGGRGDLSFYVYLDGKNLNRDEPELVEGAILFWLIEPVGGEKRENVYPWYWALDDDFWDNLREELLRHQERRHLDISDMQSEAIRGNKEGVQDMIRFFIRDHNASVKEDPEGERNIQRADDEIELSQIHFAGKITETTHLLICECDQTPSASLHAHLVNDGTVVSVGNSETALNIVNASRGKIKEYNNLAKNPENSKALAAIFGSIGAVVVSPWILEVLSSSSTDLLQQLVAWAGLFAAIVLLIGTLIIIWPMYRLQQYEWESKKGSIFTRFNLR